MTDCEGERSIVPGRNLTWRMLDDLGRAIVTGAFDDRVFPTEAALATEYRVSRSVTREAVKMLTAKGLLSARPRRGTLVEPASAWNMFDPHVLGWLLDREFSLTLLRQFSELRIAIEPQAAALAARSTDPVLIAPIRGSFERMVEAGQDGDAALDADIGFHVAILRASNNPFYAQLSDLVATALKTSIRFSDRFGERSSALAEHAGVLDAIEANDAERARGAMALLIGSVGTLIESARAKDQTS